MAKKATAGKPAAGIRLRILRGVLWQAWPVWMMLGVIVAAYFFSRWLGRAISPVSATQTTSAAVRYWATILQVFGLFLVAHGLAQTLRMFGRPSLMKTTANWFRQLARVITGPTTVTGTANLRGGSFTVSGEASFKHRAGPGSSVERRLEILEGNLDRLQDETEGKFADVRKKISSIREAVEAESAARTASDAVTLQPPANEFGACEVLRSCPASDR